MFANSSGFFISRGMGLGVKAAISAQLCLNLPLKFWFVFREQDRKRLVKHNMSGDRRRIPREVKGS